MKKFYFSLVITIILGEIALLIWLLATIVPLHPENFYLQENAAYTPFISRQDVTSAPVIITQWLFFLMTAGILIPVSAIIIGELIRWALDKAKERDASVQG